MGSKKKKEKYSINQKTEPLNTDSKYLEVSGEEVWVCGYVQVCTPLWGEELGALHGLHIWEERSSAQGEVRSCFLFPPRK